MSEPTKRVLLIANNGQLGYALANKLLNYSNKYDIHSFGKRGLDISSEEDIQAVCDEIKPNYIINCAAYTNVDCAETNTEECFEINTNGPERLAMQAFKHNALLIHISTDYIFDGIKIEPYDEEEMPNPISVYGKSKLFGEKAIQRSKCKHIILRTSWVFGEHGKNFVKTMLLLGKTKKEVSVINDQYGGPTYAGDIADAIITIIRDYQNDSYSGIYHFSGYPSISWYEFAKEIFKFAEINIDNYSSPKLNKIQTIDYPSKALRPMNSTLSCSKIKNFFSIKQSNWKKELNNINKYI